MDEYQPVNATSKRICEWVHKVWLDKTLTEFVVKGFDTWLYKDGETVAYILKINGAVSPWLVKDANWDLWHHPDYAWPNTKPTV